jgi:hypothetical protein
MYRKYYTPEPLIQKHTTHPPKIYDFKFHWDHNTTYNDLPVPIEKILFSFTFDKDEVKSKSPAQNFLIDIIDLESNDLKHFVQIADTPIYRFWQRQAEFSILPEPRNAMTRVDPIENSSVNARIYTTPLNDFGRGETSTFLAPFKNLDFINSYNPYSSTFEVLNHFWNLFSETPNKRENRPKILYIYMDIEKNLVELDRMLLSTPLYKFTSLTDYKYINDHTFRWLINDDGEFKLDINGWSNVTTVEKSFLDELIHSFLDRYYEFLNKNALTLDMPHVYKLAIENPQDSDDSIIIYLMKGSQWRL